MSTAKLRPAQDADVVCLAALSIEVWLNTYIRNGVRADYAGYVLAAFTPDKMRRAIARDHIIVSQNAEGIDAYVQISANRSCAVAGEGDVEISHLYVQPHHQGRGLGPALLRGALDHCAENGVNRPWLISNSENTRALKFYARAGFVKIGTRQYEIDGQFYPNDILSYRGPVTSQPAQSPK